MVNTNAVAVVITQTNGICDKLALETGVFGAEDLKFLAKYKAKLASARTNLSDDAYFGALFAKWLAKVSSRK
jgi:hypothetical protein